MSSLFQTSPGVLQLPEGLVLLNNPSTVIQAVKTEHGECAAVIQDTAVIQNTDSDTAVIQNTDSDSDSVPLVTAVKTRLGECQSRQTERGELHGRAEEG